MSSIKGYIPPRKIPKTPLEIMDDKISAVDTKIDKVDQKIESLTEELKKKLDEELSYEVDEDKIVESVLAKIEIPDPIAGNDGEDGKDAEPVDTEEIIQEILDRIPEPETIDTEKLKKDILSEIPKPEKLDEDKLLNKFLKKIPDKKGDLKIITERVETDPMSVIERILALAPDKFKLKTENIDGLSQTIQAFKSQMGRGYLHGGGDTVIAGTNISIVTNPAGQKVISSALPVLAGVTSLNSLTGAINLVAGANVSSIVPVGQNITINVANQSPSIGGTITGGTANSVLFVNPNNVIAQNNANFNWNDTNLALTIGNSTTGGNGQIILNGGTLTGASATSNFLNVTGTLLVSPTVQQVGIFFTIASAGSASLNQVAVNMSLTGGYTGSSITSASTNTNSVAGTGTSSWTALGANYALFNTSVGATTGHKVGSLNNAQASSTLNLGTLGRTVSGTNSAALNIAVAGLALNATTNVAGFFGLMNSTPTLSTTTALIADNGATGARIFSARVNGISTTVIDGAGRLGVMLTTPNAGSALDVGGHIYINGVPALWIFPDSNIGSFALGDSVLSLNTTGSDNIGIGNFALQSNTTGFHNTVLGSKAMQGNLTGYQNFALGYQSMIAATNANNNVAIGNNSLVQLTSGNNNISIGDAGFNGITTGGKNIMIGESNGLPISGNGNIGIGGDTVIGGVQAGSFNIGIGIDAMSGFSASIGTGSYNIALGDTAGENIDDGNNNTIIGSNHSGTSNISGVNNIIIGNAVDSIGSADTTDTINIGNVFYATSIAGTAKIGIGNAPSATGRLNISNLPTSSAGLSSGDIWIDTTGGLNIIKIV